MPLDTPVLALPYPEPADPVDLPGDLQALAERIEALGTPVATLTTAERDALAGDDLYADRVIVNETTGAVQYYDGAAWVDLGVAVAAIEELARDAVGAAIVNGIVAGDGITVALDDALDKIRLSLDVAIVEELARDAVGAAIVAVDGITEVVDDAGNTITLTVDVLDPFLLMGA